MHTWEGEREYSYASKDGDNLSEPGGNLSTDTKRRRKRRRRRQEGERAINATSCGRRERRRNQTVCRQIREVELVLLSTLFVFRIVKKKKKNSQQNRKLINLRSTGNWNQNVTQKKWASHLNINKEIHRNESKFHWRDKQNTIWTFKISLMRAQNL